MNFTHNGAALGMTQYRAPLCYELAGRRFTLCGEKGAVTLSFRDRQWIDRSEPGSQQTRPSQYEALKLADGLYFVVFGEQISVLVLDLQANRAVLTGESEAAFCTIDGELPSGEAPGFTDEMAGTHARWVFGCDRYLELTHVSRDKVKCIWSPRTDRERTLRAESIRIRPSAFLLELDGTSPFLTDMPQGYSRVFLLQDYDHLLTVGCFYSPVLNDFMTVTGYAMKV